MTALTFLFFYQSFLLRLWVLASDTVSHSHWLGSVAAHKEWKPPSHEPADTKHIHLLHLLPLKSPSHSHFSPFLSVFLSLLLSCRGLPYFILASYITVSLCSHARYGRPLYRMKAFSLYLSFYLISPTLLFSPSSLDVCSCPRFAS